MKSTMLLEMTATNENEDWLTERVMSEGWCHWDDVRGDDVSQSLMGIPSDW